MLRIILGAIAGFVSWLILWVGSEKIFSAIWPEWYGAHQLAFTAAIKNGGAFSPDATILVIHVICAAIISLAAGFLAALVARESRRAPLILGILLLAMGVLKAVMSWPYVPIWYHVLFTALLLPMAMVGGKLKSGASK
ncbi:MAG: hypothetical protein ABI905_14545 [Betaproteobacteria bacterium]